MGSRSSRRGFFRQVVGEVGHQVGQRVNAPQRDDDAVAKGQPRSVGPPTLRATRARPARDQVTVEELLALAEDVGLGARLENVRALARRSVRLTLGPPDGRTNGAESRLGDGGALPSPMTWPTHRDQPLPCLVRLDLAQVTTALHAESPLPSQGTLWCFYATDACQVLLDHSETTSRAAVSPPGGDVAQPGRSIELSGELQLPRVWSAAVQHLELHDAEHEAWQQLRHQLAERQGVDLHDAMTDLQAIHRLLGYPDERHGNMPLACELFDRGHDLGDDPARAHPHATELEPHAGRWRLLLQLTVDHDLRWSWSERRERLYIWIDDSQLAARDFSRVRAIAQ